MREHCVCAKEVPKTPTQREPQRSTRIIIREFEAGVGTSVDVW